MKKGQLVTYREIRAFVALKHEKFKGLVEDGSTMTLRLKVCQRAEMRNMLINSMGGDASTYCN